LLNGSKEEKESKTGPETGFNTAKKNFLKRFEKKNQGSKKKQSGESQIRP